MKLEELSRLLRQADPAAVTLTPAVMDRVIRKSTGLGWVVWSVPHRRCFLLDRFTLFKHAEQDDLDLPPDHQLPPTVLLLSRPSPDQLAGNRDELLGRYWRLLFHAAAHRELEERTPADVRGRVERLGPVAFEEARSVLTQDGHLAADAGDRAAYIEFAAYYLELRQFAWNLIPVCFPSLPPPARVEAVLAGDIDHRPLFERTRLSGAPDPAPRTDDQSDEQNDFFYRLDKQADRAGRVGDTVAAAILHTRAARVAPAALTEQTHAAAVRDVHRLVARLDPAVGLTAAEVDGWKAVLPQLLDKADQGARPVEAAVLYDLQRACLDHEQTTYALDAVEWLTSGGHRPIKRPLDSQRFVRVPAHIRTAARRLTAARLSDADRQHLAGLLRAAEEKTEDRLRARFRPVLTDALQDAGLTADTLPEQAARGKTVEELLDRIVATGFLSYADLRDAIARGQVKLPDLSGPDEYLHGDLLLRLDRRLGTLLDGVYRRGEFYVRWLERGTSFLFGTASGRWASRNVLLPVGGALLAGQFAWLLAYEYKSSTGHTPAAPPGLVQRFEGDLPAGAHTLAELAGAVAAYDPATGGLSAAAVELKAAAARLTAPKPEADLRFFGGWNAEWWFHLSWLALAAVLLLLVRSKAARGAARAAAGWLLGAVRAVLWDVPRRLWLNPRVRAALTSWPVVLGWNYLVEPLILSGVLFVAFPHWLWHLGWVVRGLTVVAVALGLRSRPGRAAKEVFVQGVAEFAVMVRAGLIPGVIRWVGQFFRELTGAVEWVLARGDDWLRLRGSGGPLTVAVRVVAGVLWAPVAFLLRLYLLVLIEPMVNPLKLPLSLLFAKFVYPLLAVLGLFSISPLGSPLVDPVARVLPWAAAWLLVVGTFYLLPDAVTFLFWETRENWKLFRANRPTLIKPEGVGPHGETVAGLLRPGVHSGTVPRRYARLRAAERRAAASGDWQDARTHRAALREVADGVRRFVGRELVAVLNPSKPWGGRHLFVGDVHLGTNRIRVELGLLGGSRPAVLEFEDRSGWLVAGWAEPGWADDLPPAPARALANTLAYLYKRAGVELVREQIRAGLPPAASRFDVVAAGLMVWLGGADPVLYDLRRRPTDLRPRTADGLKPVPGPTLDPERLFFGKAMLTWAGWLGAWPAAGGDGPAGFGSDGLQLLPPRASETTTVEFTPERVAAALAAGG